jgi:hypothetical protein
MLLFCVEDVFDIRGRGCIVVPGIPKSVERKIRIGSTVRLKHPDGSEVETMIRGIEMGGSPDFPAIPILLGAEISKVQIPIGTEVWVQLEK